MLVSANLSGRQLAKVWGISPTQVRRFELAGIVKRNANGRFHFQTAMRDLVRRLLLAEALAKKWAPGEAEAIWEDRHG